MSLTSDDLGIGADVAFKLSISIGALADEMRMERERREAEAKRKQRLMPTDVPIVGSGVSAASGSLYIGLGKPNQGFFWEIRHLVIGGNLITSAPAGNAYFLVGPPQTSQQPDLSTMNLWDSAIQISGTATQVFPLPAFYSTRQFVVRPGEHLAVVITSPTATTTYVVAGSALQYPIEAYDDVIEI